MSFPDTVEKQVFLTTKEFEDLLEYSCSIPTGVIIGKQWRRSNSYSDPQGERKWWLCEYVKSKKPEHADIIMKRIFVRDLPK